MINVDNITALLSRRVKVIQRIDPCTPRVAPDLIKVFGSTIPQWLEDAIQSKPQNKIA